MISRNQRVGTLSVLRYLLINLVVSAWEKILAALHGYPVYIFHDFLQEPITADKVLLTCATNPPKNPFPATPKTPSPSPPATSP